MPNRELKKDYEKSARKVYIRTFGCQMNDRDSEALLGLFWEKGYCFTQDPQEADIILVNTCSVREHAENRALSFLGSLKKIGQSIDYSPQSIDRHSSIDNGLLTIDCQQRAKRVVGLIGCMACNLGEEVFRKMPHVNLICGPGCSDRILGYIEKIRREKIRIIDLEDRMREEDFYHSSFRIEPDHGQVVISTGCSNHCSYCVVPNVRGLLRLRKPEDIITEVERNVDLGRKKITLLGQNVNDYQYSLPSRVHSPQIVNFVNLLKMVEEVKGVKEIDFVTSHPKNTTRELFALMAESPKIKKHLHLPFQSGSSRILKLMNRGYAKEDYVKLAENYKNITKGTLSTDVMVGFPTETEEDFNQTKELLEEVNFKYAYIFKYSPRPKTAAAELDDDVPWEVKKERHKILLDLQKKRLILI